MTVGASELGQHEAVKAIALATGDAVPRPARLDLGSGNARKMGVEILLECPGG